MLRPRWRRVTIFFSYFVHNQNYNTIRIYNAADEKKLSDSGTSLARCSHCEMSIAQLIIQIGPAGTLFILVQGSYFGCEI